MRHSGRYASGVPEPTAADPHDVPTASPDAGRPASTEMPDPPVAKRVLHTWERPTGAVEDPWAWLRDRDDPDTVAYLAAENEFASAWLAPHEPLVQTVFEEIKRRVQETDAAVPVRMGPWWYTARTVEGLDYPIHCRGASRDTADEQVLLDENVEAGSHEYFALGLFDVSPDHTVAAWSADIDGGERFTLRFRTLATGTDLPDVIEGTTAWGGSAWSADGTQFFYLVPDDQMRAFQVWRHALGTPTSDDVLVLQEDDERFSLGIDLCRSERWIVVEAASKTTSEAWVLPADRPDSPLIPVRGRTEGLEYGVDHWGDRFVVLTNLDAEDFRVMTAPEATPDAWTELLPHVPGQRITAVEPFATHLAVHEWADAQQRIRILHRDAGVTVIDAGDEPHEIELDSNPEWHSTTLRYGYQSFTTPASVFEFDLRSGTRTLLKQTPTPNVDLGLYEASREWATAPDGTRVPVDVVRRRGTPADGSAPCVVYGYGSYEVSVPPWFSVARLSLLDRGWTWALAHPRGGGELGRRWYLDGKLLAKRNTFTDTLACAEHLVSTGWAHPSKLALRGGSAGGLLVGACVTMRPELFHAAVAEVPFVDVVTTMSDPSLPLTVTEWEEWGDPRNEPAASYMLGYSPYDNTVPGEYPALMLTAGLNDPRVSYHEPAKWCARLRAVATGDAPLLLRTEMGAGHGGPSGRYERWRDEAIVLAFLIAVTP
jgi:oligopeptidase B